MKKPTAWLGWILALAILSQTTVFAQSTGDTSKNLKGQIAYIGTDANVYTMHLPDTKSLQLTTDAETKATSARFYGWPTWATDGRLAYFSTHISLNESGNASAEFSAYVSKDGTIPGQVIYTAQNELFNYAYWSPANCETGKNCRDLAVLLSGEREGKRGLFVQLLRDTQEGASTQYIGRGSPFYYSWSPDGKQMLWQRSLRTLDIYDVASSAVVDTLPQSPGLFQAPAWSPVGNRFLVGVLASDKKTTDLVIIDDDKEQILATGLTGPVAFAWSPDARLVGYVDRLGPLIVVDAQTGKTIARSSTTGVLSFFWSPNSEHVAYVTFAAEPDSNSSSSAKRNGGHILAAYQQSIPALSWSVLDIQTGDARHYGSFQATDQMGYLLGYFDQFAQSHHVWSPDSQYIVYSESGANGKATISILDTTQTDAIPFKIADGKIGVWSFS